MVASLTLAMLYPVMTPLAIERFAPQMEVFAND